MMNVKERWWWDGAGQAESAKGRFEIPCTPSKSKVLIYRHMSKMFIL